MSNVGAVVVTYNSGRVLGGCLDSCRRFGIRAVVVDNSSTDNTLQVAQTYPEVTVIANATNQGFAAAANQGCAATGAANVLLLNPDVELRTPVTELSRALESGAGAAGGRLIDATGRTQAGFTVRRFPSAWALCFEVLGLNRLFPRNPVNRRYRCLDLDLDVEADVEQPAGALLMVSRKAWRAVGGFDESFCPLWFEDVDFCLRLSNFGFRIRYVPAVTGCHTGGHSLEALRYGDRQVFWYRSLLQYVLKHFSAVDRGFVAATIAVGALLRAVVAVFREGSTKPIPIYDKVIRLALGAFIGSPPESLKTMEKGPATR